MKRILSLFLMVCFFMQMSVFADGSADGAAVGTAAENSVPEFAEVMKKVSSSTRATTHRAKPPK